LARRSASQKLGVGGRSGVEAGADEEKQERAREGSTKPDHRGQYRRTKEGPGANTVEWVRDVAYRKAKLLPIANGLSI
jgi:hypothetical protein